MPISDYAGFDELLTTQNSDLYRRSVSPQFTLATGQGSNVSVDSSALQMQRLLQSLQNRSTGTGGNWDAPQSMGTPMTGYTDRTSPQEVAVTQRAADVAAAAPENQVAKIDPATLMRTNAAAMVKANPLFNGMDSAAVLKAQLARDPTGYVRKILGDLTGSGEAPTKYPANDPYGGLEASRNAGMKGYIPTGGFTATPSEDSMTDTLDVRVVGHPKFQEQIQRDPGAARHVYKAITGREYDDDVKTHLKVQDNRDKFKTGVVQDLIKRGAYYDTASGKLMAWNQVPADPNQVGGSNAPQRQIIEASPDEQDIWHNYYSRVTGRALPDQTVAPKTKAFDRNNSAMADPEIQAAITEQEKKMTAANGGRAVKLNAREQADVARGIIAKQGQPSNAARGFNRVIGPINRLLTNAGDQLSAPEDTINGLLNMLRITKGSGNSQIPTNPYQQTDETRDDALRAAMSF